MSLPRTKNVELPLLIEIDKAGGKVAWKTLSSPVASHFPDMTKADLVRTTKGGKNLWMYDRLRWASYALFKQGEISREAGIWTITPKGKARLTQLNQSCKCGCSEVVPEGSLYAKGHDARHRSKLIDRAGGINKFSELLDLIDSYLKGDIGESELAKGIRRHAKS